MNQKGFTPSDENPEWEKLEARMTSASAEAKPTTIQPSTTDEEQQRIAQGSAKADQVVGNLFAKLGVDRKVAPSASAVAAEPPQGNGVGQATVPGGGQVDLDLGGGNNPPPPSPPSGGGGQGSAGGEPSWFDKLLAFMQSPAGKIFGITVIIYIAISWISATITSPDRLAAMEKLAEINRKQKELDLKIEQSKQQASAAGSQGEKFLVTAEMRKSGQGIPGTYSRYEYEPLAGSPLIFREGTRKPKSISGLYIITEPPPGGKYLCQTIDPAREETYATDGCAKFLGSASSGFYVWHATDRNIVVNFN